MKFAALAALRARASSAGRSARGTNASTEAQTTFPEEFENLPIPSWGKAVLDSFSKPVHPVIGGVASNGGVGVGIGYNSPEDRTLVSGRQSDDDPAALSGRSRANSAAARCPSAHRLRYSARFVTWAGSSISASGRTRPVAIEPRSVYVKRWSARADGYARFLPCVWGAVSQPMCPISGAARAARRRPIEAVFAETSVPGFAAEPTFGRYRGFVEFMHPVLARSETCSTSRPATAARIKWHSSPCAITTRAGTTFIAGKRKCSSAFPGSCRASALRCMGSWRRLTAPRMCRTT